MAFGNSFNEALSSLPGRLQELGGQTRGPMGPFLNRLGPGLGEAFRLIGDRKGKGSPQQPPQMQVPQANSGFYQPSNTDARSQLLQAMMQRSRVGRQMGA